MNAEETKAYYEKNEARVKQIREISQSYLLSLKQLRMNDGELEDIRMMLEKITGSEYSLEIIQKEKGFFQKATGQCFLQKALDERILQKLLHLCVGIFQLHLNSPEMPLETKLLLECASTCKVLESYCADIGVLISVQANESEDILKSCKCLVNVCCPNSESNQTSFSDSKPQIYHNPDDPQVNQLDSSDLSYLARFLERYSSYNCPFLRLLTSDINSPIFTGVRLPANAFKNDESTEKNTHPWEPWEAESSTLTVAVPGGFAVPVVLVDSVTGKIIGINRTNQDQS